jgi:hypothetical protein
MENLLYKYDLSPTTWVYVSSIALVAFYFKFSRVLSVRNLDLLGLLGMAPGLLMVSHGRQLASTAVVDSEIARALTIEMSGFFVLFGISLFFFGRLILDLFMTRRPLLEPNLSLGGMSFVAVALGVFLAAAIVTKEIPSADSVAASQAVTVAADAGKVAVRPVQSVSRPGFAFLDLLPEIPSKLFPWTSDTQTAANDLTSRILCVLGHLAVVAGLIYVGHRHFDNLWTGVAVATLYLMLPYTQQMAGRLHHVVPAALLVWMLAMYRHPVAAGTLLGFSVGLIYYPVFLLPVWASFYRRRGLVRFAAAVTASAGTVALFAALFLPDERLGMFWGHFREMFRLSLDNADGVWASGRWHPYYRFPLSILFCCFAAGMALWPARKHMGTLLSCSAAVMLATQFWYPTGGLLFVNWYLPLLLLTMFRPNLEHRVAMTTVVARSVRRRRELPAAATPA